MMIVANNADDVDEFITMLNERLEGRVSYFASMPVIISDYVPIGKVFAIKEEALKPLRPFRPGIIQRLHNVLTKILKLKMGATI